MKYCTVYEDMAVRLQYSLLLKSTGVTFFSRKQSGQWLRWSRDSVLAFGNPSSRGSNPAEAVGFFRGEKILSAPSFGEEVKAFPMSHICGM
jgi:hypothetical protein